MTTDIPAPLPYHRALAQHLQAEEPALWQWFSGAPKRNREAEAVRLDLLKSTYRLEPASQPVPHALVAELRQRMNINAPVTLYQAQTASGMNASLAYLPGEAHVILAGPVLSVLAETELRAMLAHELAHFLFFEDWRGEYFITSQLIRALSHDVGAAPCFCESERLFSLWTEIYADRWACHASNDLTSAVSTLVKVNTGLSEVSADSYLRQADEIFSKGDVHANDITHPELFIRARALKFWFEQGEQAQTEIARMIEGPWHLERLDLLGQKKAAAMTRQFLKLLLAPGWFHTDATMAHVRRFFPDFVPGTAPADETELKAALQDADASVREYFAYLLLDFSTADRDLGDVALSAALVQARRFAIDQPFLSLLQKELALGKKVLARIDKQAQDILDQASAATR
jgi:predicted SprT family Zn-dependent metalloprotease